MPDSQSLFTPVSLGALPLTHRVVMAPLTRLRAGPGDVPPPLAATYYGQRASQGGLLITEATDISPQARAYPGAPGIHTPAQIEGWRAVTRAVHARGGLIVLQIWHGGRVSHSSMQPGGVPPVAPSALAVQGMGHVDAQGQPVEFEVPRALEIDESPGIVADFAQATRNARAAGFDGVEIHGANGYLIDQFLQDGSNQRTDAYGGTVFNRARLLVEVVDAAATWSADRIGVRLSPWGRFNGMAESDPGPLYDHVGMVLGQRRIAYLHVVEPRADQTSDVNAIDAEAPDAAARLRHAFGGTVISAGGYVAETAAAAVAEGRADAIAFGRLFIANPDLPARLRQGAALNRYDRSTFYGGGAQGYTDYPALAGAGAG